MRVKLPVNACAKSGILTRIFPIARSAILTGSVSPLIIAASIRRAETVVRLEATVDNFTDASSSISSSRMVSRVRSPINCTRCRVSIRSRRMSGGGTNDGFSNPCSRTEQSTRSL